MYARQSQEMMLRYVKNLPKDAELDITTMNLIGKPRVSRMKVSELYPRETRYPGAPNCQRDTKGIDARRPWWMGKARSLFSIPHDMGRMKGPNVMGDVYARILRNNTV